MQYIYLEKKFIFMVSFVVKDTKCDIKQCNPNQFCFVFCHKNALFDVTFGNLNSQTIKMIQKFLSKKILNLHCTNNTTDLRTSGPTNLTVEKIIWRMWFYDRSKQMVKHAKNVQTGGFWYNEISLGSWCLKVYLHLLSRKMEENFGQIRSRVIWPVGRMGHCSSEKP